VRGLALALLLSVVVSGCAAPPVRPAAVQAHDGLQPLDSPHEADAHVIRHLRLVEDALLLVEGGGVVNVGNAGTDFHLGTNVTGIVVLATWNASTPQASSANVVLSWHRPGSPNGTATQGRSSVPLQQGTDFSTNGTSPLHWAVAGSPTLPDGDWDIWASPSQGAGVGVNQQYEFRLAVFQGVPFDPTVAP